MVKDAMCSRACIAIMKKIMPLPNSLCKEADGAIPEIHEFDELLPAHVLRNPRSFTLVARCYERQNEIGKEFLQTYQKLKACLIHTLGLYTNLVII